jgi:hypothetical protein
MTIVGYVDPIDEDNHDAGIVISTDDDEEFLVHLDRQGRKLLDLIGEEVKVHGTVTHTDDGEDQITITKFEIIDFEEDYEDDLYYPDDDSPDRMDRYDM